MSAVAGHVGGKLGEPTVDPAQHPSAPPEPPSTGPAPSEAPSLGSGPLEAAGDARVPPEPAGHGSGLLEAAANGTIPPEPPRHGPPRPASPPNGTAAPESPRNGSAPSEAPANGTAPEPPANGTTAPIPLPPAAEPAPATAAAEDEDADEPTRAIELASGPGSPPDPGLYAVLGLDPSTTDAEIQTAYRRQAARLLGSGADNGGALRQLNVAYEVLGNPYRRAEYDRLRLSHVGVLAPPTPIRPQPKAASRVTRRRRPRHAVQPRYAGLGDVFVVLVVVGLAFVAGALLIPRLQINLSALNGLSNVLPVSTRRVIDTSATPAAATPSSTATPAAPTPTVLPGLAQRFSGSTVSVSAPTPVRNANESVVVKLRRDGQPAANVNVWSTVHYRTTDERWPPSGTARTDQSGTATITFNIGDATPNYPVQVQVFAQVEDQQLSWSTSFTPH
jgi:hypothetical protein